MGIIGVGFGRRRLDGQAVGKGLPPDISGAQAVIFTRRDNDAMDSQADEFITDGDCLTAGVVGVFGADADHIGPGNAAYGKDAQSFFTPMAASGKAFLFQHSDGFILAVAVDDDFRGKSLAVSLGGLDQPGIVLDVGIQNDDGVGLGERIGGDDPITDPTQEGCIGDIDDEG